MSMCQRQLGEHLLEAVGHTGYGRDAGTRVQHQQHTGAVHDDHSDQCKLTADCKFIGFGFHGLKNTPLALNISDALSGLILKDAVDMQGQIQPLLIGDLGLELL